MKWDEEKRIDGERKKERERERERERRESVTEMRYYVFFQTLNEQCSHPKGKVYLTRGSHELEHTTMCCAIVGLIFQRKQHGIHNIHAD